MPTRSLGFSPRNRLRELLNDVSLSTNGTPIESPLLLSVSTAITRRLPRRAHLSLRPLEPVPPPRRIPSLRAPAVPAIGIATRDLRRAVIAQAPTMMGRRKIRKRSRSELPAMCRPPRRNFRPNARGINRPLPAAIDRHLVLIFSLPRRFLALCER